MTLPIISVVIPTFRRPQLLLRAAKSVLNQTFINIELIIVIDGQDPITSRTVATLRDHRLRCVELSKNQGAPGARNRGVMEARGHWIAFLDDDDEWYSTKLEAQLETAKQVAQGYPIIACRLKVETPGGSYILPRRLPQDSEPVGDYLFVRRSLFRGEGSIATSMLLTTKILLLKYPFQAGLKRHQEADWLLRVSNYEQVNLQFVDAPLGILHIDEGRPRVSEAGGWKYSFEWVQACQKLLTPKAYSAFLLTAVGSFAAQENDWSAFSLILKEATKSGQPLPIQYGLFLGMWLIPKRLRQALRVKWLGRRRLKP
ncbi:glycosyltransferase [Leptolyngbya cf. ectocarpi LEGE 11479]|uniref:Glycosyltransferase n=1 Tax=Leptolyngbya cf. ectocarpi LEGE 11479 TaxID=1828722 RepID=A0A928X1P0_LEPEC|nr:glycosyltransferase family 2 protein [Leptolyngbya ectocarpi]MBE9065388.1 glycosyltransferase [Leptolyngbya cf. ectocarpi LEGE 11479]